ncbi:hypothetical protein [Streptomyces arboris]|uniref:hypothetical protein n=1 Tax=Streptomyces arboris TaxID=2600619 RepID=UPI003629D1ED
MRKLRRRPHTPPPPPPFAELVRIEGDPAYRDRHFPGLGAAIAQRGHWRSPETDALVRRLRSPPGELRPSRPALALLPGEERPSRIDPAVIGTWTGGWAAQLAAPAAERMRAEAGTDPLGRLHRLPGADSTRAR